MPGVSVHPLLVDPQPGPSLSNPSVAVLGDGRVVVNIRNLNYTLYHSERGRFEHSWGPLNYIHREDDQTLTTHNTLCELDDNLNIKLNSLVDTGMLDSKAMWHFVGLEDARVVQWGDRIYLTGVRRDTTPNGQGRMEISEVEWRGDNVYEISRKRIPVPSPNESYCEKNWMPVLDRPFHWVKWTNPTEMVRFDPDRLTTETILLSDFKDFGTADLRGGSQIVPIGDKYLAVVHESLLFNSAAGKKDVLYRHRFVVWDRNFRLLEVSRHFSFMGGNIEFCCGMAELEDNLLISFGFQDNAAFLASVPKPILWRFIWMNSQSI